VLAAIVCCAVRAVSPGCERCCRFSVRFRTSPCTHPQYHALNGSLILRFCGIARRLLLRVLTLCYLACLLVLVLLLPSVYRFRVSQLTALRVLFRVLVGVRACS
jgi:hypothetical protein